MGDWASFFEAGFQRWAFKVLGALGFGWVTYEGLDSAWDNVVSNVSGSWAGVVGPVAQVLDLAGFGEAIGIMLGGFTGMIAFIAFKRLAAIQT